MSALEIILVVVFLLILVTYLGVTVNSFLFILIGLVIGIAIVMAVRRGPRRPL